MNVRQRWSLCMFGGAVKKCSVCVSGLTEGGGGSNVCSGSENSGLDSGQESSA